MAVKSLLGLNPQLFVQAAILMQMHLRVMFVAFASGGQGSRSILSPKKRGVYGIWVEPPETKWHANDFAQISPKRIVSGLPGGIQLSSGLKSRY